MTERRMSRTAQVCIRCEALTLYVYVKTDSGFQKVCLKCAKEMDAKGLLIPEERVIPMREKVMTDMGTHVDIRHESQVSLDYLKWCVGVGFDYKHRIEVDRLTFDGKEVK